MDFYLITLDNKGASEPGTDKIYGKYGAGIYLDDGYTNKMTLNENKIVVPVKGEYIFGGYYYYDSDTSTSEGGVQLIDSSGYITSDFTNVIFGSDVTLVAKWIDDVSPTCTLMLTMEDGVIFKEVFDNIEVVSQEITKSVTSVESTDDDLTGLITEGITYGYVEDAAGNVGVCSIDIQSSIEYDTVDCSYDNYSNPESACVETYVSKNCGVSYTFTAQYCNCYEDLMIPGYKWRYNGRVETGLDRCDAIVVNYTSCDYQDFNEGYVEICSCAISGSYYYGSITCSTNSCAEGYTKLESGNYCYKLG